MMCVHACVLNSVVYICAYVIQDWWFLVMFVVHETSLTALFFIHSWMTPTANMQTTTSGNAKKKKNQFN